MASAGPPLVFSVQRFCVHDGPGVRSLVFFKGFPLRCAWCQNPESWRPEAELGFKAHLCLGCGTCAKVCPNGAMARSGRDPARCRLCFTCADRCPGGALVRFGVPRTVASVLAELGPELPFYRTSGGGVTLTGGEPALWAGFAADLAEAPRAEGIPVAMETCGLFPTSGVAGSREATSGVAGSREATTGVAADVGRLLRSLDLVLFDVKVFDEAEHRRLCGAGNARIKENLRALAATAGRDGNPVVWARLPLVPEVTAGEGNLGAWAGFLRRCGLSRLTLVPYHSLGESKRAWLGLPTGPAFRAPTEAEIVAARDVLAASGVSACAPGEEG